MLNNTAYIEFHKIYFRESDSISFDIIIRYYLKNKKFKRSCWYFTYNNHKHTFNKKNVNITYLWDQIDQINDNNSPYRPFTSCRTLRHGPQTHPACLLRRLFRKRCCPATGTEPLLGTPLPDG